MMIPSTMAQCHNVDVTSSSPRGAYVACFTCGLRNKYESRKRAQEAADAHRLFTHVSGGRPCGEPYCHADRTIRRLNAAERTLQ